MHTLLQTIAKIIIAPLIFLGSAAGYNFTPTVSVGQSPTLGSAQSFNPVGATNFVLAGAGVTSSQTTIQLASFKTPGGLNLTMTNFGNIGFGALDPQTASKLEDISFTGIVQNANGTATLTGVTRGMDFVYPYTASTTLQKSHAGGSTFILTNTAAFYGTQFPFLQNDQTFSGINTFTIPPIFTLSGTSTSQAASIAYVNGVAISGAATSTTNQSGIGLLATGADAAAGTYKLDTPRFLSTLISTSTYFGGAYNNQSVITKTNGSQANTIDPNFIATSSNYTWSGTNTFTGTTNITGASTQASTTITNVILTNVISAPVMDKLFSTSTDATTLTSTTASTTILSTSITGDALGTSNVIKGQLNFTNFNMANNSGFFLELQANGVAIANLATSTISVSPVNISGVIDFTIWENQAANSQSIEFKMSGFDSTLPFNNNSFSKFSMAGISTSAFNSTTPFTLTIVARNNVSSGSNTFNTQYGYIYAIK